MKNKLKNLKLKVKILILGILGIGLVSLGQVVNPPIPAHELLKTSKEEVLASRIYERDIVQYAYKTNIEIPLGINEIKRSSYGRLFSTGKKINLPEGLREILIAEIIVGAPQFYEDPISKKWFQIEYGTTTKKSFDKQVSISPKNFFWEVANAQITSSTFASAADGRVSNNTAGQTWANVRNAVGNDNGGTSAATQSLGRLYAGASSNTWPQFTRGVFPFAVHTIIPTNSSTTSSTIVITGEDVAQGNDFILATGFVEKTGVGTALENSDFASSTFGNTYITGTSTFAAIQSRGIGGKNPFLLNPAGLSFLNTKLQAGTSSVFGARFTVDTENLEPAWVNEGISSLSVYQSEQAGTTEDPIIYIEFVTTTVAATEVEESDIQAVFF